jgi:hypothetical protein
MANPTTATLVYTVTPTNAAPAAMETALAAVPLQPDAADLLAKYDVAIFSDNTVEGPPCVRTIVLTLNAGFFVLFPTAASWVSAFPNLYTTCFARALCADGNVVASAPVFA